MAHPQADGRGLPQLDVSLERDGFTRALIRHLAGVLEDVIGLDEAAGFISIVGQEMGDSIGAAYREALATPELSREQLAAVLVDLKRRIQVQFHVIAEDPTKIVFGNRACPFGDLVLDRPALCMMTSNVFGSIAARTTGYAKVELEQTIAQGDGGCRVVVSLRTSDASRAASGREYFGDKAGNKAGE